MIDLTKKIRYAVQIINDPDSIKAKSIRVVFDTYDRFKKELDELFKAVNLYKKPIQIDIKIIVEED